MSLFGNNMNRYKKRRTKMLVSYYQEGNLEYLEVKDSLLLYYVVIYNDEYRIETDTLYIVKHFDRHYVQNKNDIHQQKRSMENDPTLLDRLQVVRETLEEQQYYWV
jgi:hypothetical protein